MRRSRNRRKASRGATDTQSPAGPVPVSQVLDTVLQRSGFDDGVALELCRRAWADLLPPELAQASRPLRLEHGILYVAVSDSVAHQELSMQTGLLLERLQQAVTLGTRPEAIRLLVLPSEARGRDFSGNR